MVWCSTFVTYVCLGGSDWGQDFSDGVNIRKVSTSFHTYGVEYSSQGGNEYIQFYLRKPDGQTLYGSKVNNRGFCCWNTVQV